MNIYEVSFVGLAYVLVTLLNIDLCCSKLQNIKAPRIDVD